MYDSSLTSLKKYEKSFFLFQCENTRYRVEYVTPYERAVNSLSDFNLHLFITVLYLSWKI